MPSLNRYKLIEHEIVALSQQPFQSIAPYQALAEKYLKLLYDDQKALFNLNTVLRNQAMFKQEMAEALGFLRSI